MCGDAGGGSMKKHGPPPCGMNKVGSRLMAFTRELSGGPEPSRVIPERQSTADAAVKRLPPRYARTLTLDPALCGLLACRDVAAAALAGVAAAAVPAGAVALNCTPITCSSDCSRLPNRFCWVPTGTGAAVLLSLLSESSADATCEPFLWPCAWVLSCGSAGVDVKFAIEDI